jgi:hypothetical protein
VHLAELVGGEAGRPGDGSRNPNSETVPH